jgi:hypothetical protein
VQAVTLLVSRKSATEHYCLASKRHREVDCFLTVAAEDCSRMRVENRESVREGSGV